MVVPSLVVSIPTITTIASSTPTPSTATAPSSTSTTCIGVFIVKLLVLAWWPARLMLRWWHLLETLLLPGLFNISWSLVPRSVLVQLFWRQSN
uniref:Uncharacterized protein n=1 Tax=Arundo donax TaxID=35708 RepID=A0A0A9H8H1_ARUDO